MKTQDLSNTGRGGPVAHGPAAGAVSPARPRSAASPRWLGLILASVAACAPPEEQDLAALTAVDLAAKIAAGRISAERATQFFLERIAELDDAGPELGAIIELNPDALAIARDLDARFRRGGVVGPLHGVPVVLKANIDTADRLATSAGSLALAAHHPAADAPVAARLRAAGAVLIGKANLSEWANFRSNRSISGWSSLGGQTRNPYVLDRNPCGSSSGSAVAVAARLAPLAVGTETDGSIVCPAGINGVVGVKPTLGLVPQRGIIPIASSQDTAGPMARTVGDAALLLAVLADREPGAPAPSYAPSPTTLAGVRIGVVRDYLGAGNAAVERAHSLAIEALRAAGAELVDPAVVPFDPAVRDAELEIFLFEFHDHIDRYLAGVDGGPHSLEELIAYNEANAREVLPLFGQELFLEAQKRGSLDHPDYRAALAKTAELRDALGRLFVDQRLDALVVPANAPAWRDAAGPRAFVGTAWLAAVSGFPNVVVPAMLVEELPIGVSFIGPPGQEALLLDVAALFERARGEFPAPRFLPSIGD